MVYGSGMFKFRIFRILGFLTLSVVFKRMVPHPEAPAGGFGVRKVWVPVQNGATGSKAVVPTQTWFSGAAPEL